MHSQLSQSLDWSELEELVKRLKYAPCPFAHANRITCKLVEECFAKILSLNIGDDMAVCIAEEIPAADLEVIQDVLRGIILQSWPEERLVGPLLEIKHCLDEHGDNNEKCNHQMFVFAASTLPSIFEEKGTCIECLYSNAVRAKSKKHLKKDF